MTKKNSPATVLIVDDDDSHRAMLMAMLAGWGWKTCDANDGAKAVEAVRSKPFDAILMDVRMARMDGMTALAEIHRHNPAIPVIIMTAYSSIDMAIDAIRQGAHDYLQKPLDFDRLKLTLTKALDHRQVVEAKAALPPEQDLAAAAFGLIGDSAPMRELIGMIACVADTTATVLITGESGTGKELIASALHRHSSRREKNFVTVNCAALVENLLESELFGHEKGAFTGADRRRDGKFVQADGGTLFLDEIGETSPAMQAKLLRALQEGEIQRVGGQETIKTDARIIAATNRDLETEVARGGFREDLYYRLNVVNLAVPPLRERAADIPLLAAHFLSRFAAKNRRQVAGITPRCIDLLRRYPWPGNVRELENAIERGVILMRGDYLDENDLPITIRRWQAEHHPAEAETAGTHGSLEEAEKMVIERTLAESGGNRSETARRLSITRKTLLAKLRRYGLDS